MLRLILNPRLIVVTTLIIALAVSRSGFVGVFGSMIDFQQLIIVLLVLSAISLAMGAFNSFDIETKNEFVMDVVFDTLSMCACVAMLAYLLTLEINFDVSIDAIWLTGLALGLAVIDFMISLNGGAGKLLEMDREHFTRG